MRKKAYIALMMTAILFTFGCSASEQASESDIEEMISKAVQGESDKIKDDLYNELSAALNDKISEMSGLSDSEKDLLKKEIIESLNTDAYGAERIIVKEPSNNHYDVYNVQSGDTTLKEENITNIINESNEPEQIIDGTPIEVSETFPIDYNIGDYTFVLEEVSAKAYNYEEEPYMETDYPYLLEINIKGSIEYHPEDESVIKKYGSGNFPANFILNPGSTDVYIGMDGFNYNTKEFTASSSYTVNKIPDYISVGHEVKEMFASCQYITVTNLNGWIDADGYYHCARKCGDKEFDESMRMNWSEARDDGYILCEDCINNGWPNYG